MTGFLSITGDVTMLYLGGGVVLLAAVGALWLIISQLRGKYATAVHVVWYLFSLSICLTYIGLRWAQRSGAVDATGIPKNEAGKALVGALNFFPDLPSEFYGLLALVTLIVAPQILSYLLSGAFGSASRPRLVAHCVSFFSWGMAKSSAVAAGVLLTLSLFGISNGWHGFDATLSTKYTCFAAMLLVVAFVALLGKTTLAEIPILANSRRLEPLRRRLGQFDKVMVRHRAD
jgi:hypothetical protein